MTQILIAALVGAGLFLIGWLQHRKVQASLSWPSTPGRILSAKVDRTISHGNQDEPDTASFTPAIQYEYLVNNQHYLGNRIAFAEKSYSRPKQAEEALMAFQIGASVWVFYDPAQPEKAVLERKAHGGTTMMVLGAVILLVVIVGALR